MARFSSRTKPSAEEWGKKGYDLQGKNHSSTLYTQTERIFHMSQTEKIFRTGHGIDDHNRVYSPPQINLFKDHGDDINMYSHFPQINLFKDTGDDINMHSHFPSIVAYGSPKKTEEFSSKERRKGVPGYKNYSPFSWDNDDHSTDDTDDENYDRHGGYEGSYLPKPVHTRPEYDTNYGMESPKGTNRKPSFVPPPGRHQKYTVPVSTSPPIDAYHETARNRPIGHGPPRSKPETDTHSQKTGWKPLFEPARHPQYSAPVSTSPKKNAVNQPVLEEEYVGTIDCRKAAWKYKGIFVP